MERADWIDEGLDPADARFLMLTAITHHRFSSPNWGEHEVRKLHAELAEIDLLASLAVAELTEPQRSAGRRSTFRAPQVLGLPGMRHTLWPRHAENVSMRCLLVDDNRTFLETARGILGQQGVTVAGIASSTAEALRQARVLRPDVAIVDIGLGGESGFDLARDLVNGGVAVILTSASAAEDYGDLVADNPAAGFVSKAELSAAEIRRILGRRLAAA